MAVEASPRSLFPPQVLISNREIMKSIEGNTNFYNSQTPGYGMPIPATIAAENLIPSGINDTVDFNNLPNFSKNSDSGITTYNNHQTTILSRKRLRESMSHSNNTSQFLSYNPMNYMNTAQQSIMMNKNCSSSLSFLGEDMSLQIDQQQFELDRLISQHMEKVRIEVEEKRRRQARKILGAIEVGLAKRLRAKEEEILKIGKLNWALEEKVKSLCIENQIWRDLAHSNEATVNALRTNLEQVLASAAQVKNERTRGAGLENDDYEEEEEENDVVNNELADDAESCCGSSGENDVVVSLGTNNSRNCRNCGKGESCVLLLPCRHLCLCTVCGSSLHTCPVCKSTKNASVNVNMS